MSKEIKNTSLWKLAVRFSLIFFIVTVIIKLIMSVFLKDFYSYIKTTEFRNYIIGLGVFSILYGLLMASLQKQKHKNK